MIYQRALGIEKRPAERRRLLHLLIVSAVDPQQIDSEVAARRELAALEPGSDEVALTLVDALERAGQPRQAAQVLEERLARRRPDAGPTLMPMRLRAAALYESAGALDRAAEILAETERGLPAGDVAPAARGLAAHHGDRAPARHAGRAREAAPGSAGAGTRAGRVGVAERGARRARRPERRARGGAPRAVAPAARRRDRPPRRRAARSPGPRGRGHRRAGARSRTWRPAIRGSRSISSSASSGPRPRTRRAPSSIARSHASATTRRR